VLNCRCLPDPLWPHRLRSRPKISGRLRHTGRWKVARLAFSFGGYLTAMMVYDTLLVRKFIPPSPRSQSTGWLGNGSIEALVLARSRDLYLMEDRVHIHTDFNSGTEEPSPHFPCGGPNVVDWTASSLNGGLSGRSRDVDGTSLGATSTAEDATDLVRLLLFAGENLTCARALSCI